MRVVSEGNGIRPGYSGLVTLSFTSLEAAKTFYESMQCYKGTTLGTVVTLGLFSLSYRIRRAVEAHRNP
ncbi:hypothetical protein GYMLUDRAFT_316182 [Collybiopsis luxurians FD-317 M1]|nr:hypothetical protein GYMLUDRAFT_316182 [Collybiopsis luxurians FD-317 M1]